MAISIHLPRIHTQLVYTDGHTSKIKKKKNGSEREENNVYIKTHTHTRARNGNPRRFIVCIYIYALCIRNNAEIIEGKIIVARRKPPPP